MIRSKRGFEPRQYQKERARRRKALKLLNQGFTLGQIAKQVNVDRRTVYRDLQRTERYAKTVITRNRVLLDRKNDSRK